MGWFARLFGGKVPENLPPEIEFLGRRESFSLVVFKGAVREHVPAWLRRAGYRQLETRPARAPFDELYETLGAVEGPGNTIVSKAVYELPGFTVLLDPEMVLSGDEGRIAAFCEQHATAAWGVIWERYSQTVSLTEAEETGVRRRAFWVSGKAEGEQKDPWPPLQAQGTVEGLLASMTAAGLPVDRILGDVDATVLRLDESEM